MFPLASLTSDLSDFHIGNSHQISVDGEFSCELLGDGDMDQLSQEIERERWVLIDCHFLVVRGAFSSFFKEKGLMIFFSLISVSRWSNRKKNILSLSELSTWRSRSIYRNS